MTARGEVRALVLAELFSIGGTRLSLVAIPWLVLTLSGDPILTGLVVLAETAPYVLAKALGGPLIDRLGPRTIAMAGDGGSALVVPLVPLLGAAGLLTPLVLIPLVAGIGALRGPADAAKQALIPAISRRAGLPLERMTGLIGTTERLASTIGVGLAGGLVALIGADMALAVNAFAFGLSALIVFRAIRPAGPAVPRSAPARYRDELAEGTDFLRRDGVLLGLAVMIALTNLLDQAFATVLLPVWAQNAGHSAAVVGLLFAIQSGFARSGRAHRHRQGARPAAPADLYRGLSHRRPAALCGLRPRCPPRHAGSGRLCLGLSQSHHFRGDFRAHSRGAGRARLLAGLGRRMGADPVWRPARRRADCGGRTSHGHAGLRPRLFRHHPHPAPRAQLSGSGVETQFAHRVIEAVFRDAA